MKKALHPGVVAGILIVSVCLIGYIMMKQSGGFDRKYVDLKDMPMPKAAADEMAKMAREVQAKKARGGN